MRFVTGFVLLGFLNSAFGLNDFFEPSRVAAHQKLVHELIPQIQEHIGRITQHHFNTLSQFHENQPFDVPTFPGGGGVTIPTGVTLPSDLPTLPGGGTISIPTNIGGGTINIPTIPGGTINIPTIPGGTLPGGYTIPPITAVTDTPANGNGGSGGGPFTVIPNSVIPPTYIPSFGNLTTCLNAFNDFQAQAASCGLISLNTNAPTTAGPTTSNMDIVNSIVALCNSQTCDLNKLQASGLKVFSSCSSYVTQPSVAPFVDSFTKLNQFVAVGCAKDTDGTLCLPKFINAMSQLTTIGKSISSNGISNSVLDTICSPCSMKVIETMAIFSASTAASSAAVSASFGLICLKDPTNPSNYCLNTFFQAGLFPTGPTSTATTANPLSDPNKVNAMCSLCTRKLFASIATLSSALSSNPTGSSSSSTSSSSGLPANFGLILNGLCSVNPANGQRCLSLSSGANLQQCDADIAKAPTTCPQSCSSALTGLGCCLGTMYQLFLGASSSSGSISSSPTTASPIFTNCQAYYNLNSACTTGATPVTLTFKVSQLDYGFCNYYSATCKSKLINDIAAAALVDPAQVTVSISYGNPGTVVQVYITNFNSGSDANAVANILTTQLQSSTGIPLPSTSQYAAASGVSSGTLSNTPISNPSTGANSANSLKFSFVGFFLAALAYVFMH